jgi:hypothetical protein
LLNLSKQDSEDHEDDDDDDDDDYDYDDDDDDDDDDNNPQAKFSAKFDTVIPIATVPLIAVIF